MQVAPVVVLTCDKYLDTLRGFAYLFNKYWYHEQPVLVVGYANPTFQLPPNFTFLSIGQDEGVGKWSNGLIRFLHHKDCPDLFTLFLEDYWLIDPVDTKSVATAATYMRATNNVLKFDLALERAGSARVLPVGQLGKMKLLESDPHSMYHMSLYIGMWKRDLLKKILIANETPWDVEIAGTVRLRADLRLKVMGTDNNMVPITLAHRNGDSSKFLLDALHPEDREEIVKLYPRLETTL